MGRWRACALALLLMPAVLACTPKAQSAVRPVTDDDLRAMALRAEDLPPGFALRDEKLRTNDDAAALSNDPETVLRMLDEQGRAAGFTNLFTADASSERPQEPVLITGSVERYIDAAHARQAMDEAEGMLKYATTPYSSTTKFTAPLLGDQTSARRMYTTDENGRDLIVYWVYFRQGGVLGEVLTASPKHRDDKGERAIRLARLLHERVNAGLR